MGKICRKKAAYFKGCSTGGQNMAVKRVWLKTLQKYGLF
jgi:hypothetical protein